MWRPDVLLLQGTTNSGSCLSRHDLMCFYILMDERHGLLVVV